MGADQGSFSLRQCNLLQSFVGIHCSLEKQEKCNLKVFHNLKKTNYLNCSKVCIEEKSVSNPLPCLTVFSSGLRDRRAMADVSLVFCVGQTTLEYLE